MHYLYRNNQTFNFVLQKYLIQFVLAGAMLYRAKIIQFFDLFLHKFVR